MNGEKQLLVTDEAPETEKQPVGIHDFGKRTKHFKGLYRIYLILIKKI